MSRYTAPACMVQPRLSSSDGTVSVMRMRWRHLLFMHWPVPVDEVRPLVPEPFEIDCFDGTAWVGLIPFTMEDVSPVVLPRIPCRGVTDFHECNVRTYVRHKGEIGVYFFSLDAASRLGVWGAKNFFHLPYKFARIALDHVGDDITYSVDRIDAPRATTRCRWRAGRSLPTSQSGDLSYFLTERYQLFTTNKRGEPCRCRISHKPWPLREAELLALDDELVAAAGIELPDAEPVLHHADVLDVRAGRLGRLDAATTHRR